ncbi:MAG: hypothetical protein DMG14_23300 [Acidobacteria bacterium]|nr:MAG: hypothetical protein DMG14_23300 [Acidobacteriota bacterium]
MPTRIIPTLSTIERLLDEVEEYSGRLQKVRHKLNRLRQGSEAYLNGLPDLEVALDVLRSKAEHAHEALEEFEESLTDTEYGPRSRKTRAALKLRL